MNNPSARTIVLTNKTGTALGGSENSSQEDRWEDQSGDEQAHPRAGIDQGERRIDKEDIEDRGTDCQPKIRASECSDRIPGPAENRNRQQQHNARKNPLRRTAASLGDLHQRRAWESPNRPCKQTDPRKARQPTEPQTPAGLDTEKFFSRSDGKSHDIKAKRGRVEPKVCREIRQFRPSCNRHSHA